VPGRPGATLTDDLDAVDRLDDEVYVAAALVTACGSSRLGFRPPSPLTDPVARYRARDLALARGPRQAAFAERLLADPPAVRALVRRMLEDCAQAFFADAWARVQHHLAADARYKADLLARHGLAEALAAVSPAVALDAERHRIVVDKLQDDATGAAGDGVTLTPTAFGRPHLLVVYAPGWRPVLQYPAAPLGATAPVPLDVVRQRLDALAHPVRIRLCRTLARGAHTTGELAAAWGLTAPEVSRHLAVLRKAGLISTRRRGRYVLYQLDLAASARLGTDLLEAVLR
jgi:DNA-binding transcriptional ArsR family regulator